MPGTKEQVTERAYDASNTNAKNDSNMGKTLDRSNRLTLLSRGLRIEWLGQTVASLCWIASVFTIGLNSSGDWLQLFAASSWLIANIATLLTAES